MIRAPGPARSRSRTGVTARQRAVTPVRFVAQAGYRIGLRRCPRRMGAAPAPHAARAYKL